MRWRTSAMTLGTRVSWRTAIAAVSVAAALLSAAPVFAALESREPWSYALSGSYECPGGTFVDWETGASGVLAVRAGKEGIVLAHDQYRWWATDTRRSDGETLYTTGHGQTVETKATHLTGGLYSVTVVDAGQPFVVRDPDGDVLARDRGSVRTTYVFDAAAGEIVIEEASIRVNGPHPGFDNCAYFE